MVDLDMHCMSVSLSRRVDLDQLSRSVYCEVPDEHMHAAASPTVYMSDRSDLGPYMF